MQFAKRYQNRILLGLIGVAHILGASGMAFAHQRGGDFKHYQRFAEELASGQLDLSIIGFHGSDFVTALWYLWSSSPMAHLELQMVSAFLIPFAAYGAAYGLYKNKWHGMLFASAVALMPYVSYSYITGYTQASNILFFLLTIIGAVGNKWWTGITWAIAILTKPFAVILLPLLLIYAPRNGTRLKRFRHVLIGLGLCALYVTAQYIQIGEVLVGVHGNTDALVIWDGPIKVIRNAAWGVQTLFSVHNYYYADPSITGHWNLLHTTPVLIVLGLFALFAPKTYFRDNSSLHLGLLTAAVFGFALNSIVSMDNYYMQFMVLIIILAALPVLMQHQIWIPIVLLTLHYQWFYFFLDFREAAALQPIAFALPIMIDITAVLWCMCHTKAITHYLKRTLPFLE